MGENVFIKRSVQFYNPKMIELKNNIMIDDFTIISADQRVSIGNNVHIHSHACLYGRYGIELHDFAGISSRSVIYTESDNFSGASLTGPTVPDKYKVGYEHGKVIVGRHSMVGTNSTVMPGVIIEEGVAIGAHSLVKRSCEAWGIYVGVPAKRVGTRSSDLLELEAAYRSDAPLP